MNTMYFCRNISVTDPQKGRRLKKDKKKTSYEQIKKIKKRKSKSKNEKTVQENKGR